MEGMKMINILFEDNHLLVVEKPINVPVQADDSHDEDLLTMLKKYVKDKYNKPGNVYVGLVHRLDRPVGGVMVFAKTSKAASRLSEQVRTHKFIKEYLVVIDALVSKEKDTLVDKLYKDEKTNMVTIDERGKEAILEYELLSKKDNKSLLKVNLKTGRSHQIRVQFASRDLPLYGDQRYNKKAVVGEQIALYSYKLSIYHPITDKLLTFEVKPKDIYPWNLF
jgi:23S rRNA pseudouridine1911/1915/1917 synthase